MSEQASWKKRGREGVWIELPDQTAEWVFDPRPIPENQFDVWQAGIWTLHPKPAQPPRQQRFPTACEQGRGGTATVCNEARSLFVVFLNPEPSYMFKKKKKKNHLTAVMQLKYLLLGARIFKGSQNILFWISWCFHVELAREMEQRSDALVSLAEGPRALRQFCVTVTVNPSAESLVGAEITSD